MAMFVDRTVRSFRESPQFKIAFYHLIHKKFEPGPER